MKTVFLVAIAGAAFLLAAPAAAQVPLKPGATSLLLWQGDEQAAGFRTVETIYRTQVIPRGKRPSALPVSGRRVGPSVSVDGKPMDLQDYMQRRRVSGLLAIKDGRIVLESYGLGRTPADRWTSFSVAKSVTSSLVGAAIQDGKIRSIDDLVVDYVPELKGGAYDAVSIRQMLMMSSGVRWNEDYGDLDSDVVKMGVAASRPGANPIVDYLGKLPRDHAPGARFHYNTGETDLVAVLLKKATGKGLADYLSEKIWRPAGMEQDGVWMVDGSGLERGGCCISMTLRDYGRFGLFMLQDGVAGGRRILPPGWVKAATTPQIRNGAPDAGYGYFWWMVPGGYAAEGIFGQAIYVYPADRTVVVFNSAWPDADKDELWAEQAAIAEGIRGAAGGR